MRTLVAALLLATTLTLTAQADAISPGVKLETAKKTLQRHGYDVDALKYGLSIVSLDKNIALDFCRIDDDITLVLSFDRRTDRITSLSLYFIPDHRTSKLQVVVRDALEIRFEEDGVYTLKLKRKPDKPKVDD